MGYRITDEAIYADAFLENSIVELVSRTLTKDFIGIGHHTSTIGDHRSERTDTTSDIGIIRESGSAFAQSINDVLVQSAFT